ncbi:MAG: restriction endonuclease [Planctomycetota bacterium]|nr:MAG: restriction endonuclease [Planctomycetota bacterium]
MNYWTKLSIDFANQRNYLDELFRVYPTIPEGIRDINERMWEKVETSFKRKRNREMIQNLLYFDLFPIKDSYVAYLKRDRTAIERNPQTINRLCGRLYEMGLDEIYKRCGEPKETNRQIGPMFRRWVNGGALGLKRLSTKDFLESDENAILDGGDAELMAFAREHVNYNHDKGLDLVCRMNGKYLIGEAKFLTDFGGHQNAQFNDAISIVRLRDVKAIRLAILDGVLYIKGRNKMHRFLFEHEEELNIMSALVLRDFLYQV